MSGEWSCRKGRCLLIPSGPNEGQKHLFALLLDPVVVNGYGSAPQVLLACVTSIKPGALFEDACLLAAGEHPFITHDSYVDYRFTRLEPTNHIEQRVKEGVFVPKEDCSPELIQKIVAGALKSRRISREYKLVLERVLFS